MYYALPFHGNSASTHAEDKEKARSKKDSEKKKQRFLNTRKNSCYHTYTKNVSFLLAPDA